MCRIHKCNCTRRALSRGHRPDDKEPGKEVHRGMSLPKGNQTKEYKMSAEGMLPMIEPLLAGNPELTTATTTRKLVRLAS